MFGFLPWENLVEVDEDILNCRFRISLELIVNSLRNRMNLSTWKSHLNVSFIGLGKGTEEKMDN